MKTLLTLLAVFMAVTFSRAQCGFDHMEHEVLPMGFTPRSGEVVTIPLVFHVMHANGLGDVSDDIILAMVQDLNDAYIDHQIEFCLATNDPYKRPHTGINRVNVSEVYPNYESIVAGPVCYDHSLPDNVVKNLSWWPSAHAYQVYVVPYAYFGCNSVSGYATFPSTAGNIYDGTVVAHAGLSNDHFRKYLITHEIGHGLGLYHTFQSTPTCNETDCENQGDRVCDTPAASAPSNSFCNVVTCDADPTNWMDYGWSCADNFTQGQGDRMHSAINSTVRGLAATSGACGCPFDFDGDGIVTVSDLMVFLSLYGQVYVVNDMLNMLAVMGCGG